MAGTYRSLELPPAGDGHALAHRIDAAVRRRFVLRGVSPLRWPDVYGLDADAWALTEQEPHDLGLVEADLVDAPRERAADGAEAMGRWPLSPWSGGLCWHFDLPPRDWPTIWGSGGWQLWRGEGVWCQRMWVEWPMSSVGRDPRWPAWWDELTRSLGCSPGG